MVLPHIFYRHYIYLYQILCVLRLHLVQRNLFLFNALLEMKHTAEVGPGFN